MIATWEQYINTDDFTKLNDFVTHIQNHTKQNKVCVLYGTGSNGKSTFCNELINMIGNDNVVVHGYMPDFNKFKNLSNKNLIIIQEFDKITLQQINHILQFMNNADVSSHVSIMIVTNDVNIFKQYNNNHDQLFEIINFNHKF